MALAGSPALVESQTVDGSTCANYRPPSENDTSGQYLPPSPGDTSGQYLPDSGTQSNTNGRQPREASSRPPMPTRRDCTGESASADRTTRSAPPQAARGLAANPQSSVDPASTRAIRSDTSAPSVRSNATTPASPVAQYTAPAPAVARGAATVVSSPVRLGSAQYQFPVGPARISSGYFDPNYPPSENRQHLGVDMLSAVGTPVYAPISGIVVTNKTGAIDVMQAYLVIRGSDGVEHVLGHIASSLLFGTNVRTGQQVGTIRSWPGEPGRSHVHWGINRLGVAQAMTNDWGWGRAPVTATMSQAAARGWVRP